MNAFETLFQSKKAFIGMVHLRPTVGYPDHPGIDEFVRHALQDAQNIEEGGGHGICIENDRDQPHTILITEEQKQCIAEATRAIVKQSHIPVGIGILLNDWKAALDIAKETGCAFVRIDVFVDRVDCPDGQGIIEPEADKIVAYRKKIGAEHVAIYADIQVKHKILLEHDKPLIVSAQQAKDAGADGVIVTGTATGKETPIEDARIVKKSFPDFPVLIGAGITAKNIADQFAATDGGFVGTSLKDTHDVVAVAKVREQIDTIQNVL